MIDFALRHKPLRTVVILMVMLGLIGGVVALGVSVFVNNARVTIGEAQQFERTVTLPPTQEAATPSPSPAVGDAYVQELLLLVNAARCDAGLVPLVHNPQLDEVARVHAMDMAENTFFDHTGSDGSDVGERASAVGYPWVAIGENLAAGQPTVDAAFDSWMGSRGHRANILNEAFREMGVSRLFDEDGEYRLFWVQIFGTPPDAPDPPACP